MHYSTFDQYHHDHTLIHQLDPRLKIVLAVLFIVANALLPDGAWLAFGTAYLGILFICAVGKISLIYLLKRSLIVVPFLLAAVTIMFTLPGETIASFSILGLDLTISNTGLIRFVSIFIRSWIAVQMAILLTATTRFPDILHGLRHLRVPTILVSIISFMYRYLFVLADEAGRLMRGRAARSGQSSQQKTGGSLAWRARVTGGMIGQLFIRSLERSDRVYNAMLARGYTGEMLTMNPHIMHGRDWVAGLIFILYLLLIQSAGHL